MKALHIVPAILVMLTACAEPSSTQTLSNRMTASLTANEPCNRPASIEYLPAGTRIRLPEASLFVVGRPDLTECGRFAIASVTEAMLDPRIMQVVIEPDTDASAPASSLSLRRADAVKQLLSNVGFTQTQPPVLVQQAAPPSPGVLAIVLTVSG